MFQNINSGYTLKPVTHILCLRQKKHGQVQTVQLCMSNMFLLLCTFFFFFLLKTKFVDTR